VPFGSGLAVLIANDEALTVSESCWVFDVSTGVALSVKCTEKT
jgi:hypothetical protein